MERKSGMDFLCCSFNENRFRRLAGNVTHPWAQFIGVVVVVVVVVVVCGGGGGRGFGSDNASGDDVKRGIFLHSEDVSGSLCGGYGFEYRLWFVKLGLIAWLSLLSAFLFAHVALTIVVWCVNPTSYMTRIVARQNVMVECMCECVCLYAICGTIVSICLLHL
jgi:hypothetical protein